MRRFLIAMTVAALGVTLAACGSSSKPEAAATTTTQPASDSSTVPSPTSPTGVKQACEVVSQAEAETVMGRKLLAGQAVTNPDINSCTFTGDPNGPTAQLEVYVSPGAKKFYDDEKDILQHEFTDVPGLGDEAHEEDFNIFFRKGDNWVALRVTSLDEWSTFKPRAEALAKAARLAYLSTRAVSPPSLCRAERRVRRLLRGRSAPSLRAAWRPTSARHRTCSSSAR